VLVRTKDWDRYGLKAWIEAAKKRLHHNVLAIRLFARLRPRRRVPAAPAECRLCDRKGDRRLGARECARCAVSGRSRCRDGTAC
jgi:hypothetical protein